MLHQILDNLVVAVEAGGAQRCRIGACGTVDIGTVLHQQLHNGKVASCTRTPQRWRTLDRLPVKRHRSCLLHIGIALVEQILHHLVVTIPAGDHQGRSTSRLCRYQLINLCLCSALQVALWK